MRTGSELLTAFETILGNHGLSHGRFLTLVVMNRNSDAAASPSTLAEKERLELMALPGKAN